MESSGRSFDWFLDLTSDISRRDADYLLYLGAGVSQSIDHPAPPRGRPQAEALGWNALLQRLLDGASQSRDHLNQKMKEWLLRAGTTDPPQTPTVEDLLSKLDKLQVAWLIGTLYEAGGRDARIRQLVQPPRPGGRSALLNQITRLPASVLITTNYDDTLQEALESRTIPDSENTDPTDEGPPQGNYLKTVLQNVIPVFDRASLAESFGQKGTRLFYLHGSVNHDSRIVLDRFEYADLISEHDGLFDYASHLLRSMPAIYIGFGLDDPSFNLMENRIHSADSSLRPMSYAFVPFATEEEQTWWANRNLRLIQYGNPNADNPHESLPRLIRTLCDTRKFLCWAEPERPADVHRQDDRTESYFTESLRLYTRGRYQGFVDGARSARAALASTLFWGELREKLPADRPLEDIYRWLAIRIRLGLFHYKLRYVRPNALKRAQVNANGASDMLQRLGSGDAELRIYEASAKGLEARALYTNGRYERSRQVNRQVCVALRVRCEAAVLQMESPNTTYDEGTLGGSGSAIPEPLLNAIQVYGYAKCQISRVNYQLVEEPPSETRREADANALEEVSQLMTKAVRWIENLIPGRALAATEQRPEPGNREKVLQYYRHSLRTIAGIASWFRGRHLLGAFTDVIPTREERNNNRLIDRIDEAIDCFGDTHPSVNPSPRWQALRLRYLARAHALRWYVGRWNTRGGDYSDLATAYSDIEAAFALVSRPGLRRSRIVTHFEMARIGLIGAFGIVLSSDGDTSDDQVALQLASVSAHLSRGLEELEDLIGPAGGQPDDQSLERDAAFLAALAFRLNSYRRVLATHLSVPLVASLRPGSRRFVVPSYPGDKLDIESDRDLAKFGIADVIRLYRSFDSDPLGRNVQCRIDDFQIGLAAADAELEARTAGR